MSVLKKPLKSKFLEDDDIGEFVSESQYLKDSPAKGKKPAKRQRPSLPEEEDISKLVEQFRPSTGSKKKTDPSLEVCKESRQRIMNVMGHHLETRKQSNENLLSNLADVLTQSEADYNAMKENEKKLEQLTGALMKCIQQASTAQKQKLKMLKDIHTSYKKECEDIETEHKAEADKLTSELEENIQKLQKKLVTETKRSGWETLRRTIYHAMQNDL